MKPKSVQDYKNPDKRCRYPFTLNWLGYCWGYGERFDRAKNKKELLKLLKNYCPGCEYWKPAQK